MEVAVTMILTGLIATLAYSVLGYVQEHYGSYRELSRTGQDIALFHARLEREVMEADQLLKREGGFELLSEKGRTIYSKGPGGSILRRGGERVDTFQVRAFNSQGTWRGEKVAQGRADELLVELKVLDEKLQFRFHMDPDAVTLMKEEDGDRPERP